MADYCTLAELEALLPSLTISTTGTVPTDAQATVYITHVTAEIDGVLRSLGYAAPIDDTSALAQLKTLCLYGAAALTLKAAFPSDGGAGADGGGAGFYEAKYQAMLGTLRDGSLSVDDSRETGWIGEGFTTDSDGDAYAPFIEREDEW